MKTTSIGFIGAGNMASALIGGLCTNKDFSIHVSDPNPEKTAELIKSFAISECENNASLVDRCEVIVLAVKPQVVKTVLTELSIDSSKLILSVAAGIRCHSIQAWSGEKNAIVRSMPNTPALVKCGATGLFANEHVRPEQKQIAETIMTAVGLAIWVDQEELLDTVTAVSGSGPAYFFYMMEAMESAGIELGLSAESSRLLTLQTALGAAKLALNSDESTARLREKVTSPGGTTEAAINTLQASDSMETIKRALKAAHQRSQELAQQLADET